MSNDQILDIQEKSNIEDFASQRPQKISTVKIKIRNVYTKALDFQHIAFTLQSEKQNISVVELDFSSLETIQPFSEEDLCYKALKFLTYLGKFPVKILSINLKNCPHLNLESFKVLQGILNFNYALAEYLHFDFQDCIELDDECIEILCDVLSKKTHVKNLRINLEGCGLVTDLAQADLKEQIFKMDSLKYLDLKFEKKPKLNLVGLKAEYESRGGGECGVF